MLGTCAHMADAYALDAYVADTCVVSIGGEDGAQCLVPLAGAYCQCEKHTSPGKLKMTDDFPSMLAFLRSGGIVPGECSVGGA